MNQRQLKWLRLPSKQSSVSVADVQRIRRQRRSAQTEQEYSAVRSLLRDMAGNLRTAPATNTKLLKAYGIAIIVFGLIIGGLLFYATYQIWPSFLEDWGS